MARNMRKLVGILALTLLTRWVLLFLQERHLGEKFRSEYFDHEHNSLLIGCFARVNRIFRVSTELRRWNTLADGISTCFRRNFTHLLITPGHNWRCGKAMKHNKPIFHEQIACGVNTSRIYIVVESIVEKRSDIKPYCSSDAEIAFTFDLLKRQERNLDPLSCVEVCGEAGFMWAVLYDKFDCYCTSAAYIRDTCDNKKTKQWPDENSNEVAYLYLVPGIPISCFMEKRFFPVGKAPYIGIISYPGSGNTWFRHLLEKATGYYTGSVYAETQLFEHGFFGEIVDWRKGTTLGIKDHYIHGRNNVSYEKVILLIRNPYDTFVAEFNRKVRGHVGHRNEDDFFTTDWTRFVWHSSKLWKKSLLTIISWRQPKLIIYYEDLLSNTSGAIEDIVSFLGVQPNNLTERIECLEWDRGGFFRRKHHVSKRTLYTEPMIKRINNFIATVRTAMLRNDLYTLPPYEVS